MKMLRKWFFLLAATWCSLSCAPEAPKLYTIAINPWPGYELLYLAEQKGIFEDVGLNIELEQLSSLADAQRAFMAETVDGFTSTIVESVLAQIQSENDVRIVLVADYSNGGDLIIADRSFESVQDLKGKTIGCEVTSLGIVVLEKALRKYGISISDVNIKNVEQLEGLNAMNAGQIDAYVTYPPTSISLLENDRYHTIFTTKEVPREVIDVINMKQQVLDEEPEFVDKFLEAWQRAIDYMNKNPEESIKIMADREGVSSEEFKAVLENDIQILSSAESKALLSEKAFLSESIEKTCRTLALLGQHDQDCSITKKLVNYGH